MRLPFPDWNKAKLALEGYAEDGVSGKLDYDDMTNTWYADLNDAEHEQYMANLSREHNNILQTFGSLDWHGAISVQGATLGPPRECENRLALYLVHPDCRSTRGYKVIAGLTEVIQRKTQALYIGCNCEICGKKSLVVITWEDIKPRKGGEFGTGTEPD